MTNINAIRKKVVKGLKDYCDKNGFKQVTFGLSGGMDSALVLAIACEALGKENVHTMMMTTKYTSKKSVILAQKTATLNGVSHKVIDVQPIVDRIEGSLDFVPTKKTVPENIQARVRGLLTMTCSNEQGTLVLACGNKSEADMGYCTLYGDMCGGYAPILDVYKTEVYQMADLYNKEGKFVIPKEIIKRPSSAELAFNQKDQDTLPAYEVLDPILAKYIHGNQKPKEDEAELVNWVQDKFNKNAFKRAQSAPCTQITDYDRGPVTFLTSNRDRS